MVPLPNEVGRQLGESGKNASSSGAMQTLARQPLGEVLVWAVAIFVIIVSIVLHGITAGATIARVEADGT